MGWSVVALSRMASVAVSLPPRVPRWPLAAPGDDGGDAAAFDPMPNRTLSGVALTRRRSCSFAAEGPTPADRNDARFSGWAGRRTS